MTFRARERTRKRASETLRALGLGVATAILGLAPPLPSATAIAADAPASRDTAAPGAPEALHRQDLERRLPLGATDPARVDEVARSADSSVNFWQLRVGMPTHLHRLHDEVIVVLEGTVETTLGTKEVILGPGDAVLVPRDTVHGGRVVGDVPARGYSVFAPAFDGKDRVPAAAPAGESEGAP